MKNTEEPSKEQMIIALREQIDVRALQVELQTLNASLASERVRELEAIAAMAEFQQPNPADNPDLVQHVVTQNDIDTIPEFKAQGFEVGQTVGIPKAVYSTLYPKEAIHTV